MLRVRKTALPLHTMLTTTVTLRNLARSCLSSPYPNMLPGQTSVHPLLLPVSEHLVQCGLDEVDPGHLHACCNYDLRVMQGICIAHQCAFGPDARGNQRVVYCVY